MDSRIRRYDVLASELVRAHVSVRLVGIDGCGGAGKTTFAARLSRALQNAAVIHTDDFASHDEPFEWWPTMLRDVVEPLLRNEPASYRPYDWVTRQRADPLTIEPAPVVLIEGVGATRNAWRDKLAMRIWVDCPRDVRLERGIARDGEELREFWHDWMRAEEVYVAAEHPYAYADLVVDGASEALDPENEFVVLEGLRAPR